MTKSVLIVEDNVLLAMDAESMLRKLGVTVVDSAASVDAAHAVLDDRIPDFALLDVDLAGESSEPIAERLVHAGVPFAFVSGYDDAGGLLHRFGNAVALVKPLQATALRDAMTALNVV